MTLAVEKESKTFWNSEIIVDMEWNEESNHDYNLRARRQDIVRSLKQLPLFFYFVGVVF